jgi:SpoVK/Ycf46/Vps4 family AAA+-type ATPase
MNIFWIIMVVIGVLTSLVLLFILAQYIYEKIKTYKSNKAYESYLEEESKLEEQVVVGYQEEVVQQAMAKLNELEGLQSIKSEMEEIVNLIRYDIEEGQLNHEKALVHMAFLGNPGTGKTTVARIIAEIFKGLGVLEKGHLVEVDRSMIVAGFIGQTAIQTKEKIEQSLGGVLFIDEAYNLVDRGKHDFGLEAIDTLLKMMEDHRGKFVVIVAGYNELMLNFLASNPGLNSRFDKILQFNDHSEEELWKVCVDLFNENNKSLTDEASDVLNAFIMHISSNRKEGFGNAREIRKIVNEVVKNQKIRLSKISKEERSELMKATIELADVEEFKEIEVKYNKQIGYKFK